MQFVRALGGLVLLRIQFKGVLHVNALDNENLLVQLDFTGGFSYQPAFAGGDIARLQRASEGAGQSTGRGGDQVVECSRMLWMDTRLMLVILRNLRMGREVDRIRLHRHLDAPIGSLDSLYLDLGSINDFVGHKTPTLLQVQSGGCRPSYLVV